MIKQFFRIGIVAVMFLSAALVKAQQSDFQIRNGIQISGNFSKNTKWEIETESRFVENALQFERLQIQPSIAHSINKLITIAIGYRFAPIFNDKNNNILIQNRWNADLSFRKEIESFEFKLRSRCNYDMNDLIENNKLTTSGLSYRHAFTTEYNIWGSRWSPSVSFEFFHRFRHLDIRDLRKLRYSASIDYRLSRNTTLSTFYFIDKEINRKYPTTEYILGTSLKYKF
jgi:hypothetical protein